MRVGRERLILLGLCVVEGWRRRVDHAAEGADVTLRLALAVLYGFSGSGVRDAYDLLWENLSRPRSGGVRTVTRQIEAGDLLDWIIADVGAPADQDFRVRIFRAARSGEAITSNADGLARETDN